MGLEEGVILARLSLHLGFDALLFYLANSLLLQRLGIWLQLFLYKRGELFSLCVGWEGAGWHKDVKDCLSCAG